MRFLCATCGDWHDESPDIGTDAPIYWRNVPESERADGDVLTSDWCAIADEYFFVRGVMLIPILVSDEHFGFGLWSSVSRQNFDRYVETFGSESQSSLGSFFGWMSSQISGYPDMLRLQVRVKPRDAGWRPLLELEPTEHPLAFEQQNGITMERVNEIVGPYLHPEADG